MVLQNTLINQFTTRIDAIDVVESGLYAEDNWRPNEHWRTFFLRPHMRTDPECISSHKTGSLRAVTTSHIEAVLGVVCRRDDASGKVETFFEFRIARGQRICECALWDWKGSAQWFEFSTFGDQRVFKELFGKRCVRPA